MKKCIICHQSCGYNSKYCRACGKLLRKNWSIAYTIKKKFGIKVCPMCFVRELKKGETFCKDCSKLLFRRNIYIKKPKTWKDSKILQKKLQNM